MVAKSIAKMYTNIHKPTDYYMRFGITRATTKHVLTCQRRNSEKGNSSDRMTISATATALLLHSVQSRDYDGREGPPSRR